MTAATFQPEITAALKAYDLFVVCLDKTPEEFLETIHSLLTKAIRAYETRGPHLRHGIALDKHVTVILSQTEDERPLCGIYFNLHSPHQKAKPVKLAKALPKKTEEPSGPAEA